MQEATGAPGDASPATGGRGPGPSGSRAVDGVGDDGGVSETTSPRPEVSAPPPRRRGFGSAGDMARSLGVVIAIVAVILVLVPHESGRTVTPVDWHPYFTRAAATAHFRVLAPKDVPATWTCKFARTGPTPGGSAYWQVGFVVPTQGGDLHDIALSQSDGNEARLVRDQTHRGSVVGTEQVAGRTWQRYERTEGSRVTRALVTHLPDSVVVVSGAPVDWSELEILAATAGPQ